MIILLDETWPTLLPLPVIDYSGRPRNSTIFDLETGFIVSRRSRFQKSYYNLSVSWVLSEVEFAIFESFVLNNLGNGVAQFKMELRFPRNSLLTEWAVRFELGYEAEYGDGKWTVGADLELLSPISSIESIGTDSFIDPETGGVFIDPETGGGFVDPEH